MFFLADFYQLILAIFYQKFTYLNLVCLQKFGGLKPFSPILREERIISEDAGHSHSTHFGKVMVTFELLHLTRSADDVTVVFLPAIVIPISLDSECVTCGRQLVDIGTL